MTEINRFQGQSPIELQRSFFELYRSYQKLASDNGAVRVRDSALIPGPYLYDERLFNSNSLPDDQVILRRGTDEEIIHDPQIVPALDQLRAFGQELHQILELSKLSPFARLRTKHAFAGQGTSNYEFDINILLKEDYLFSGGPFNKELAPNIERECCQSYIQTLKNTFSESEISIDSELEQAEIFWRNGFQEYHKTDF